MTQFALILIATILAVGEPSLTPFVAAQGVAIASLWFWVRGEIKECRADRRNLWTYILESKIQGPPPPPPSGRVEVAVPPPPKD